VSLANATSVASSESSSMFSTLNWRFQRRTYSYTLRVSWRSPSTSTASPSPPSTTHAATPDPLLRLSYHPAPALHHHHPLLQHLHRHRHPSNHQNTPLSSSRRNHIRLLPPHRKGVLSPLFSDPFPVSLHILLRGIIIIIIAREITPSTPSPLLHKATAPYDSTPCATLWTFFMNTAQNI
jgi:hypothetical protein